MCMQIRLLCVHYTSVPGWKGVACPLVNCHQNVGSSPSITFTCALYPSLLEEQKKKIFPANNTVAVTTDYDPKRGRVSANAIRLHSFATPFQGTLPWGGTLDATQLK